MRRERRAERKQVAPDLLDFARLQFVSGCQNNAPPPLLGGWMLEVKEKVEEAEAEEEEEEKEKKVAPNSLIQL